LSKKWLVERCIRQFVLNAEKNAMFLSSLMELDPYTAENVILNAELKGDIRLTS
jgi:hypothetical protein